jgi:hypothetical protein
MKDMSINFIIKIVQEVFLLLKRIDLNLLETVIKEMEEDIRIASETEDYPTEELETKKHILIVMKKILDLRETVNQIKTLY